MDKRIRVFLASALALVLVAGQALAVEGKWTPEQILAHDPIWLQKLGLEIPPSALWSDAGGGLLEAAVRIDGCSAGFVSAEGLLVTNHHCAFSILQQHSTPERDLITDGFLATGRDAELGGAGTRATVPHRVTDVTAVIEGAVPAGAGDLERFRAIERKQKELVAECEKQPHRRCRVATFDGGVRYTLVEQIELPDVRLAYAPPLAVGEYGGEVDNWSWPRHTGDFALLRVYTGPDGEPAAPDPKNVPYRPPHFFPVAHQGVEAGSFVMVAGYPGLTYRSLTADEMAERAELYFPRRAELYRAWIDLMEAASAASESARIALADRVKSLANVEKNARGQVAGIARGDLLAKKRGAEAEVLAWAAKQPKSQSAKRPDGQAAVDAHQALAALVAEERATWDRDFLLEQMGLGPKPLDLALTLVRWAVEKAKPDLDRQPEYMERTRDRLSERLDRDQKRLDPPAEAALLADVLRRFTGLPASARVPAVDRVLAGAATPEAIGKRADALLAATKVTDLAERRKMFGETVAELHARHDPLLDLAFDLDAELLALKERQDTEKGAISRLRPVWRRAVEANAGRPVAPDANGTLRVSLAHVEGYSPRDAVWMEPLTTLAGMVEKATGEEPFKAPPALLAAAGRARYSRWAVPGLGDVPVCFLADADTTGGNSGSPVLDGRGHLVGLNFDRVWENVANDFGYDPAVARNVSVDVRYLLWMLETEHGAAATPLLREMGVVP